MTRKTDYEATLYEEICMKNWKCTLREAKRRIKKAKRDILLPVFSFKDIKQIRKYKPRAIFNPYKSIHKNP